MSWSQSPNPNEPQWTLMNPDEPQQTPMNPDEPWECPATNANNPSECTWSPALNAVTIKYLGMPPILEFYADNFGDSGSYTGLDLFVAFDHQSLAIQSWDLTTFQTPLSLSCLTTLPMGATNSVQILQGKISFIIQEEMPDIAATFMDNVNVRGPPTCYETNSAGWYISTAFADPTPVNSCALNSDDQHFEVILKNTGIHWFIWEHLNNVNWALKHVKKSRWTFLGWKMDICLPEVVAVGNHCTYEGCHPEDWKVQKIWDWPGCNTLTDS